MNLKKLIGSAVVLLGLLPATIAWGQSPKIKTYTNLPGGGNITNLSNNGLWATAQAKSPDNDLLNAYPSLINTTTEEFKLLVPEEEANFTIAGAYDVTNDGNIVVGQFENMPAFYSVKEQAWTQLEFPDSIKFTSGWASSISADGRFIVGILNGPKENTEKPFLFIDGVYTECKGLPTLDKTGQDQNQNRFVDISDDGNIILGMLTFQFLGEGASYIYNRQTKEFKYIGGDVFNKYTFIDECSMSSNGKWVAGSIHWADPDNQAAGDEYKIPFKYSVENNQITLYKEDADRGGFCINDGGTVFGGSPWANPYRSLIYRVGDFWYGLDLVLKERYGIDYTTEGFYNTGTIIAVSDDSKTLASIPLSGSCYILTLPETFEEATKSVNLLSNAILTPAAGSKFSKLSTIKLMFDRTVEKKSTAKVSLYKGDQFISSALSITASDSDGREFTIGFRTTTLEENVSYTIKVQAGSFGIPNSEVVNKEIQTNYVGRKDAPVYPVKVAPEDGSTASELSYSSPMTIQFDVPILLKEGAVGKLYQEGLDEPISDLILATSTNMMAFYPAIKQNLFKDVKYRVEIPAGVATDIMGNCANDAIVLHYEGIFQKTPPSVGDDLFIEDFNDLNTSYNHFLLFDGDKNEPNATAKEWKFDNQNTPWNLQIHESEENTDNCAGSISMYDPAGKSNDWMTTVQLSVPDKSYVLYFKSQSFKKDKQDRLKVYIWEYDNELSVLNAEIVAQIEKDGELVYNEIETPGKSEELLTGDWKENKISLEAYAGKNIYIAFANQNEDQSAIFVDDIKVVFEGTYAIGSATETSVVNQEKIKVEGFVKITGDKTYSSLKASYKTADGIADELTLTGLNLKKDDIQSFTFDKELSLPKGKNTSYSIKVTLDDEEKEATFAVNNLSFLPKRKVVIEEATGAWCQNCPLGILAFEHLEKTYPEQFIPIGVHGGGSDPYTFDAYVSYLKATGYPSGKVNRSEKMYSPMIEEDKKYSFTSKSGDGTFKDIFLKELENITEAELNITKAEYNSDQNKIMIETSVKYASDITGANYKVLYVTLEDNLPAVQQNNLYNNEQEIMGDFGKGGIYGTSSPKIQFKHVARSIIGVSFEGLGGYIPSTITADEPIVFSVEDVIPSTIKKMENASIACLLINANTGRVVNADHLKFSDYIMGIESNKAESAGVTIRVDGKQVIAEFANAGDAVLTLYNMDGMVIDQTAAAVNVGESIKASANGNSGIILVRTASNGKVSVKKVVIE